MNLLPKSHQDFSQKEYWNSFFQKRGKKAFEWYGEFEDLCSHLHKYIKPNDNILMIGCGNSKLSMDMYDFGFRKMTNIDISQVVIRQMQDLNKVDRLDMKYIHMDALNMTFSDSEFSVVLDKGTLDALMPDDSPETIKRVDKLFSEINRVVKSGGKYICISLLQEHILIKLLSYFPKFNWSFRIIRCYEAEQTTAEKGEVSMPVFIIVCNKFNKLVQPILEVCLGGERTQRVDTTTEVVAMVTSIQTAAQVCSGLNRTSIADQNEVSFDLYKPDDHKTPRFTIYVLDQATERNNGQYAAFIVPQGRETEWLFSTKDGRKKLLQTAKHNRLAIVTMHRGQKYDSLDAIKDELAENVKNLAPPALKQTIPYLSLGDDVGQRAIRFEGTSDYSGRYIIEDSTGDNGSTFRRLIFLDNQNIVQSEAKLKNIRTRGGKKKLVVDSGYLACKHHVYMCIGTQMACEGGKGAVAVIGLGGGGLCTFLHQCLPQVDITAIDIDPAMLKIAKDWFGLAQTEKLQVRIQDGLEFIREGADKELKYQAILFDVDNKDASLGMSCPPKEFLTTTVLKNVKKCIENNGIFVLNLVLRDENLHKSVIDSLKTEFKTITSYKLDEDLNEIIFCTNKRSSDSKISAKNIKDAAEILNKTVRNKKMQNDDIVDVDNLMGMLKMYD